MKKALLLLLLFLLPLAQASYITYKDDQTAYMCLSANTVLDYRREKGEAISYDEIYANIDISMGDRDGGLKSPGLAGCSGLLIINNYERYLHINSISTSGLLVVDQSIPGFVSPWSMSIALERGLSSAFGDVTTNTGKIKPQHNTLLSSSGNCIGSCYASSQMAYPPDSKKIIYDDELWYYYALEKENFKFTTRTVGSDTFSIPNTHNYNLNGVNLVNPSKVRKMIINDNKNLDLLINSDAARAYYLFTNDFSYVQFPAYIKSITIDVSIFGASGDLVSKNRHYVNPQDSVLSAGLVNKVVIPKSIITPSSSSDGIFYSNVQLGNSITWSQRIFGNSGEGSTYKIEFIVTLAKNPMYRHLSPVDFTHNWNDVFGSGTPLGDCGTKNFCVIKYVSEGNFSGYSSPLQDINDVFDTDDVVISPNIGNDTIIEGSDNPDSSYDQPNIGDGNFSQQVPWGTGSGGGGGSGNLFSGGSLENQMLYAVGFESMAKKNTFFNSLQGIADIILEIFLALYTLFVFVMMIYSFLIVLPSAYRKFMIAFDELTDQHRRSAR